MDPVALKKARSRLRVARKAVEDLATCKDYDNFTDVWYIFLTASKNVYTVLEQGAKGSPQSRQWFGTKKQERRGDALLQYIYQARNDDEHGLLPVAKSVSGSLQIGVSKPGYSTSTVINSTPNGGFHVASIDGRPVLVEQTFPHIRLMQVRDRGGKLYDPPEKHMGSKIPSNMPLPVAELTTAYLEAMIGEAEALA